MNLAFQISDELVVGVYANMVAAWHTPVDFTLDFAVIGMSQPDAEGTVVIPCPVVARIKVPLTVMFDIARVVAENVARYEQKNGPIRKPGDGLPLYPPQKT